MVEVKQPGIEIHSDWLSDAAQDNIGKHCQSAQYCLPL